jgi:hypothetical protein
VTVRILGMLIVAAALSAVLRFFATPNFLCLALIPPR